LNAAPGAGDKPAADAWLIYRRLLKYAKPYSWVFFIGVLGAILFAAANASLVILVRNFLDGAFIQKNPDVLWQVPLGVIVLFTVRGSPSSPTMSSWSPRPQPMRPSPS
jgi:ABC-type multidrug transport system fused ATPase/permease subunit